MDQSIKRLLHALDDAPAIGQVWMRPGRLARTITDVSETGIAYTVDDPDPVSCRDNHTAWDFWVSLGGHLTGPGNGTEPSD